MLILEQTKTFKKCLKRYRHDEELLNKLKHIVDCLVNEKNIHAKYKDH